MTKKLFWEDMYLKDFNANVISCEGNEVVLDATAFYPRSGGLVSDTGYIENHKVEEVFYRDDTIVHRTSDAPLLHLGQTVNCRIDWDRRYKLMRMHTATHIICSVVNKETGALITGNKVSPDISHIDLSLEVFDREKINLYIETANKVASEGLEVKVYFMKREEALKIPGIVKLASAMPPSVSELRIVQIGDFDLQADGGVHVRNTSEIGKILFVRAENKGKNNRRLYFTLDWSHFTSS